MKRLLLLTLSFLFLFTNAAAQVDTEKIDRIVSKVTPVDGPGGILAVIKDGEVVHKKGYGYADTAEEKPITNKTVFQIGSVSKQMTAVAVLLLEEEGKLSLDDPISKYFPGYNDRADDITIRHLLTHSSGIKNYTSMPEWDPAWSSTRSLEETIDLVKGKELNYEPGDRFSYCNTGYAMLAAVIEQVTGKSYGDFMKQKIFFPLGMENTRHGESNEYTGPRAKGYSFDMQGEEIKEAIYTEFPQLAGAGSIVSTADDMILWDEAVREEKLLSGETWYRALSSQMPIDPDAGVGYGYGWFVGEAKDFFEKNFIRHTGGMPGFTCGYFRFADNDLTVIWLSNTDFINSDNTIMNTAKTALELDEIDGVDEMSKSKLLKYEGVYEHPIFDIEITAEDGYLEVNTPAFNSVSKQYLPVSSTKFVEKDVTTFQINFIMNEEDEPYKADMIYGNQTLNYIKQGAEDPDAYEITEEALKEYTGTYNFTPQQKMEITLVEGTLRANLPGQPEYTLDPVDKDQFVLRGLSGFRFVFKRSDSGEVIGVTSDQPNGSYYAPKE